MFLPGASRSVRKKEIVAEIATISAVVLLCLCIVFLAPTCLIVLTVIASVVGVVMRCRATYQYERELK